MAKSPLLSFLLVALSFAVPDVSTFDVDTCLELGFSSATLLCSSCDELSAFNLQKLQKECKECCQADETSEEEIVSLALHGTRGLGLPPELHVQEILCFFQVPKFLTDFVKGERPKQFPNLTIKYVKGAHPILKLMNEDQEIVNTLSIASWNADTIEEFLREKLTDYYE